MTEQRFRYTACGLDNIYLLDGFRVEVQGPHGPVAHIDNLEGLHRAIGEDLVRQRRSLNGKELRYLRHELGLSQSNLADWLGESEQTVARREKAKRRPAKPTPQERLIRFLYEEHIGGNEKLTEFLKGLAALDEARAEGSWSFEDKTWHRKVA